MPEVGAHCEESCVLPAASHQNAWLLDFCCCYNECDYFNSQGHIVLDEIVEDLHISNLVGDSFALSFILFVKNGSDSGKWQCRPKTLLELFVIEVELS